MAGGFERFDSRHYSTTSARAGYGEWAATYEQVVQNEMDVRLLERLSSVAWGEVSRAADLGCGTGRTGVWLKGRGIGEVDGVDITPEMVEAARAKGVYRSLAVGDVLSTGLGGGTYDLAISCLVDEHVDDLGRFYGEAGRVLCDGGRFVLVGYHPHFIMVAGMPTHFHRADGEAVGIETHVHLISEHVRAARAAGFALLEMEEGVVDDEWVAVKPKWGRYLGHPVSFAVVWRKAGG